MHPFLKNRHIIPPSGPEDARIALVGEQPGVQELRFGKVFEWRSFIHDLEGHNIVEYNG